jgi:hypothetical protein
MAKRASLRNISQNYPVKADKNAVIPARVGISEFLWYAFLHMQNLLDMGTVRWTVSN